MFLPQQFTPISILMSIQISNSLHDSPILAYIISIEIRGQGYRSVEQKIPSRVELHIGNDTGDELQEDQQREVRLHLVAGLNHRVRHALQYCGMPAWVHRWHHNVLQEGEFLHRQSLIKVLPLDVQADVFVADRGPIFLGGTEEHPWGMIVLVVNDIHLVVPKVLFVFFLLLHLSPLENNDLIFSLLDRLLLKLLFWLLFQILVQAFAREVVFEDEILLVFMEIFGVVVRVEGGFPLPVGTDLDEMVSCQFELVGGEFSVLLEDVLFWRRVKFLADFLGHVVGEVLGFIPVVHVKESNQYKGYSQTEYILQIIIYRMIKQQDFLFKIVIVGNQGVGKSSLFIRFCDDNFVDNYLPTIGVDFRFKMTEVDNKMCKLQIWDTAGQERFRTITSAYYRSSQVVLIVYDLTDPASFREVEDYWIQQAKNNSDSDIMICLVGNKCDMPAQIDANDIHVLAQSIGLPSYFVSAKTGEDVDRMFSDICEKLIKTTSMRRREKEENRLNGRNEVEKKRCCR